MLTDQEKAESGEFVCDLVIKVDDARPFDVFQLREYVERAVQVVLNDEEAGQFEAGGEDATVSLAVNFGTLKKR
jgi:hypothetical protein